MLLWNVCVCIYWHDLWAAAQQWLAVSKKPKNPDGAQSHEAGYLSWSSTYDGILRSGLQCPLCEEMDMLTRLGQTGKERTHLLPSLIFLPGEGVPSVSKSGSKKGMLSSCLKIWITSVLSISGL